MTESTSSVLKTLCWLLAILLIGMVVLYRWHNDNQRNVIAGKDAEVTHLAQRLKGAERELRESERASEALRAEKKALKDQSEAADQAEKQLADELKALTAKHAKALGIERQKASQESARLQKQLAAADERIAALGTDLERLRQEMAGTATAHLAQLEEAEAAHQSQLAEIKMAEQSKMQGVERELQQEIDFYRTALEGSEPERASQLEELGRQIADAQRDRETSQQAMQVAQQKASSLTAQLTDANQAIGERDQAVLETKDKLQAVEGKLAREQTACKALRAEHEESIEASSATIAKWQERFEAAQATCEQAKAEAAAALQSEATALAALREKHKTMVSDLRNALDATKQTLAGAEAELTATKEATSKERQAQEQQLAEAHSKISTLEQTLARTQEDTARELAISRHEGHEEANDVRRLYIDLSKLESRHTDQGMLLSLTEDLLQFPISKADLPQGELPSLDQIAKLLITYPSLRVRVEGHTDSRGQEATNLKLSQQRANAVKQALVERGVAVERVIAKGMGAARPIADNASSAGRRKNRRVEIYVIDD